jgi:hypothetical protein
MQEYKYTDITSYCFARHEVKRYILRLDGQRRGLRRVSNLRSFGYDKPVLSQYFSVVVLIGKATGHPKLEIPLASLSRP